MAAAVVIIAVAPEAGAQTRAPTDAELRATYCIGATQNLLKKLADLESKFRDAGAPPEVLQKTAKGRADIEQRLARLQSYILPKLTDLDPVALALAMSRADADASQVNAETEQMIAACPNKSQPGGAFACAKDAPTSEASARLLRCTDTSWLPF
jgi:hypothetical protein